MLPFAAEDKTPPPPVKTDGISSYRADQFLAKPHAHVESLDALHRQWGARTIETFSGLGNLQVVSVPPELEVEVAIARFLESGLLEYAEPDYADQVCITPNDPGYNQQWALPKIQAPQAWDVVNNASSVTVAVLDTGVDYTHADLAANIWINPNEIPGNGADDDNNGYVDDIHGIDAVDNDSDPFPSFGFDTDHGTLVAGVIGARANNGIGVAGVCWQVRIMVVKIGTGTGDLFHSRQIKGLQYAIANGANIINLSFGGAGHSRARQEVLTKARNRGVIVVAGIGNANQDNDALRDLNRFYPASYELDNIVAVGASAPLDARWDTGDGLGSNFGLTTCDLMAPGENVYSTSIGNSYRTVSGTSFATPHASGALALLKARFPQDSHLELINRLLAGTDPAPAFAGRCVTGGRLNLYRAVTGASARPANDDFQGAFPLAIPAGKTRISAMANNVGASKQPGEPNHGGVSGGRSVWWKWQSPSGTLPSYYLHTAGSGFEATVAVYPEINGVPNWSAPVHSDNAVRSCSSLQMRLPYIQPDTGYFVVVDGVDSHADGPVRLTLSQGTQDPYPEIRFGEATIRRNRVNGTFTVRIYGPAGKTVDVQRSDTLLSDFANSAGEPSMGWQDLIGLDIPAQGWIEMTDTGASQGQRFYRIRRETHYPDPAWFSCNTVGYVDRVIPPGFSLLSNPLIGQSICVPDVFNGVPAGFAVYTWNEFTQSYLTNVHQGNGVWSGPDCLTVRQPPGFGCFVYNPLSAPHVETFIGRVWQGYFEDSLPAAWAVRSAPVPDHGRLSRHLGVPAEEDLLVYLFENGNWVLYEYSFGEWSPTEPWIGAGDAFWLRSPTALLWKQHYWTWPSGGQRFD